MAVGQDYQCINIKAAQYNREKKLREEEERLAAERRAAEQARAAAHRAKQQAQRQTAAQPAAKRRTTVHAGSTSVSPRTQTVRGTKTPAYAGNTGSAAAVRGAEYGFGALLSEAAGTAAGWLYRRHRERVREIAEEPVYTRKRVGKHRALPIALFGYIAVFAVIAGMLLVGNARISSAKCETNDVKAQIAAEQARSKDLDEALSRGMDAVYVENYAVNVLGMVKKSEVSKTYITFNGEDKIVSGSAE